MKTPVAVVSMFLLGSAAAYAARAGSRSDPGSGVEARTAPPPPLVACHRAVAPLAPKRGATGESAREIRNRLPRPARNVDAAQLEAIVTSRMPSHDATLHRELGKAIDEEARRAGLDPLLIVALIHVESSFDPGAISYAGATGLMQLRARTLAREIERSGLGPADPRDPVANVRAGVRYLRRLVTAFGSTDLALMAYNAGPNRILSYYRAGEIPERFHSYPQRIHSERERLRSLVERRLRTAAASPAA